MNIEEFSNEFDILVDSYKRFKSFDNQEILDSIEFNEYEKSLFLTKAQESLVISYYNGREKSFEDTEENRRYLSSLIKTAFIENKLKGLVGISKDSIFYKLPEDLMFITFESAESDDSRLGCLNGSYLSVIPTTQDQYLNIKDNPFRQPNDRRVLRLDNSDNIVELVSKYDISRYVVRYIKTLSPIILIDLPNNLTINNINKKTECKLKPELHRTILERAVYLALQSKSIGQTNNK